MYIYMYIYIYVYIYMCTYIHIYIYVALKMTANVDCYRVGAVPQLMGSKRSARVSRDFRGFYGIDGLGFRV